MLPKNITLVLIVLVGFARCTSAATPVHSPLQSLKGFDAKKYENTIHADNDYKRLSNVLHHRGGFVSGLPTTASLSLPQVKVFLQLLLTTFNVLCWSFPLKNKLFSTNTRVLSLANCFAGGIFLMLSFGHLIPESISALAINGENGHKALLYVIVGFLSMLLVGKVLFQHDDHSEELPERTQQGIGNLVEAENNTKKSSGINSAMILCFAMSIHSFFESTALGMAKDVPSAMLMAACIALHQPAESLALVVAFLKSNMNRKNVLLWLAGFSTVAMLGNLAGNLINVHAPDAVEAIIVAMTAGTFIYVGTAEIVGEEFEDNKLKTRLTNFVAYVLGMVAMFFVTNVINKWESSLGH